MFQRNITDRAKSFAMKRMTTRISRMKILLNQQEGSLKNHSISFQQEAVEMKRNELGKHITPLSCCNAGDESQEIKEEDRLCSRGTSQIDRRALQ